MNYSSNGFAAILRRQRIPGQTVRPLWRKRPKPVKFRLTDNWHEQYHWIAEACEPYCHLAGRIVGRMQGRGGFLILEDVVTWAAAWKIDETLELLIGFGIIRRV
jgi:hypothetical protein